MPNNQGQGPEDLQGDGVLVMGLEKLVPLMNQPLPGGGQLGQLLLSVLNRQLELVAHSPLQLPTTARMQPNPPIQPLNLTLDHLSQSGTERALPLLLGMPAQTDEVLAGDPLGFGSTRPGPGTC